jgi:hypothetical protein
MQDFPNSIFICIDKNGDCGGTVTHKNVKMITDLKGDAVFKTEYPMLVVEHSGDNPFVGEVYAEWMIDENKKEIPGTRKTYKEKPKTVTLYYNK